MCLGLTMTQRGMADDDNIVAGRLYRDRDLIACKSYEDVQKLRDHYAEQLRRWEIFPASSDISCGSKLAFDWEPVRINRSLDARVLGAFPDPTGEASCPPPKERQKCKLRVVEVHFIKARIHVPDGRLVDCYIQVADTKLTVIDASGHALVSNGPD